MIGKAILPLCSSILFINTHGQHCILEDTATRSVEEDEFNAYVNEFRDQGLHLNTEVYCLPVVFHIINDPAFSLARVQDQLQRTNQHLRRSNIDTVNTRELFVPYATDSHIELQLATVGPGGMLFNGIHHIDVPGFNLSMNSAVIAANMYDRTRYLNVWVFPGMLTATSVFPWNATDTNDGVMMGPQFVGYDLGGSDPAAQGGKVFTHEIGHYLGLYHTFHGLWATGECIDPDCENTGDRCCDTPLDYRFFPIPGDQCTIDTLWCEFTDSIIPNDENYMFYNLDHCQNMFSNDQRTRMRACLNSLHYSLTTSETHALTGINCSGVGLDPVTTVPDRITLYPNPAGDIIHIRHTGDAILSNVTISDQTGRIVAEGMGRSMTNAIDLSHLSPGT